MTAPSTLSLDSIVDVVVEVSPLAAPRNTFNEALFIGNSMRIANATRLKKYGSTFAADMVNDGFQITDPEYLAMQAYFSQSPAPLYGWVGMQDTTALGTVAIDAGNKGANYKAGDVLTVGGAGTGGTFIVDTVDGGGAITAGHIGAQGTGYSIASPVATTGGSGDGNAKVDISAVGETPLQAYQACRAKNFEWYEGAVLTAAKADHEAIAAWNESASPSSIYAFTTADADVPTNTAGNVFAALKTAAYKRTIGQYHATDAYAICRILGYACGQNTGLANSAFTLKFKEEVGGSTSALDATSIDNIEGNNGNVYLSYGNYYNIFEQGVMSDGTFFDQILNRDMLRSNIQLNVMDLLYGAPKIPQTNAGVNQLVHAVNQACDQAVSIGYLSGDGALWTGPRILNLNMGDPIPAGYIVQTTPLSEQSDADRQARKAPPIYVAIKEAGAVHSALVGVYVNM